MQKHNLKKHFNFSLIFTYYVKKMHFEKCSQNVFNECFAKHVYLLFYNILLTRRFNIVKHYLMTFKKCLKNYHSK